MKVFLESLLEEIRFSSKKLGLLVIFFIGIPVLSIWFAGAYYNEYVDDVGIAVLDEDYSSLSRRVVQYFEDSERFEVNFEVSSREELQDLIDEGKVYMGIYIPINLESHLKEGSGSQILILTNGSNVVIGNNAYAGAAEIIQTASAGASIKVIEGKGALPENMANNIALSFKFTDRMLYDPKLAYINYLIYGFVAVLFQQMMLSSMATLIFRNPEETARKNTLAKMVAKMTLATIMLMTTGTIAMAIIHAKFGVVFDANIKCAILISVLFAVAISCQAILLCAFTKSKTRFSQIAYMLSLPTFLTCGYVWPLDQMPKMLEGIVKLIWPLVYFARPFDEVMIKHLSFEGVRGNIIALAVYSMAYMPLALVVFKKQFGTKEKLMQVEREKLKACDEISM